MKTGKKKKDNRGLTLIELIVTVAIIAIFSGVVLTFVTTGSNTFRSTSSSAKVQMETQETFDQIEEMIIDVNRSLYYANGSGDSIGSLIKNDIKQSGGADSVGNKTFIVCNEYENNDNTSQYICDILDWDKEDATIYYSQMEYTADSSADSDTETASYAAETGEIAVNTGKASDGEKNVRNARTKVERSVFATGILDFRADISKAESDKIVRFQLSTENGTKQIETLHSVSLRNKVKIRKPGTLTPVRPRPTATPAPTKAPEPTEAPEPTATPVPTETPVPTAIPTPVPTATATPVPTPTVTPIPGVQEEESEIIPNQKNEDAYAVVKGRAYTCGIYGRGQDFGAKADNPNGVKNIVWSIEYGQDVSVTQGNNGMDAATVTAGENCDGYVLCAKYDVYSDSGEIIKKVTARKYVSVIKGVEITTIPDVLTVGKSYRVGVNIIMKGITKNSNGDYNSEDQVVYAESGNGNAIYWSQPNGYYLDIEYNSANVQVKEWGAGKTMTLKVDVNGLNILVKDSDGVGYLTAEKELTIVK